MLSRAQNVLYYALPFCAVRDASLCPRSVMLRTMSSRSVQSGLPLFSQHQRRGADGKHANGSVSRPLG